MLKAIQCDMQQHHFRHITSLEEAGRAKKEPGTLLWLDLLNPSDEELVRLGETFQLHPLAIEDASHEHQRPKVDEYEHFYLVVFYAAQFDAEKQQLAIQEIDMFLGKNYLITVHEQPLAQLDEVEQRWKRNAKQLEWGVGVLLYSLLDTLVDHYFPAVDALVDRA